MEVVGLLFYTHVTPLPTLSSLEKNLRLLVGLLLFSSHVLEDHMTLHCSIFSSIYKFYATATSLPPLSSLGKILLVWIGLLLPLVCLFMSSLLLWIGLLLLLQFLFTWSKK